MKTFTLDNDNNISAFVTAAEAAAATPFRFVRQREGTGGTGGRFSGRAVARALELLAGRNPCARLPESQAAASRIWARIQRLGGAAQPAAEQRAKPRIEKKAKGRAHPAKAARPKARTAQKAPDPCSSPAFGLD
jgi:hypothetical protein